MRAIDIKISGIVQGVGFRPFITKLATSLKINGWILNNSFGVFIHAEASKETLNIFIEKIKNNPPPLAEIIEILVEDSDIKNYNDFVIKESKKTKSPYIFISPDVGICDDCKNEILDVNNRRYFYPFTNCTNCGPRFSIIKEVPYDRKLTTMADFQKCNNCNDEYKDINDRRFHAQPNCCNICGPYIYVVNGYSENITSEITDNATVNSINYNKSIINFFKNTILDNKIWAIKSLSGFHLCCNPYSYEAVNLLRQRKGRKKKPLAIMMRDIKTIKKYCYVNEKEEKLLLHKSRPIVLLKKRDSYSLPDNIAPNNSYLGVMLPSTPLHILMLQENYLDALIMTSGNLSSLPLEFTNKGAIENISFFVDYFLFNNRDIVLPLDDSIVKDNENNTITIRRSRGYAPVPIANKNSGNILALGCDMRNTFSISKNDFIYQGPYNGDLDNVETIERLKLNIDRYKKMFELNFNLIACDLNKNCESSKLSKEYNLPIKQVQHHHAHIASCMVTNNYYNKVIGVAFDGSGYGDDNNFWGSEFLICDLKGYKRVGHLDYTNFLGEDDTLRDCSKNALCYIYKIIKNEKLYIDNNKISIHSIINKNYHDNYELLFKYLKHSSFTQYSSSMGRLFDAVSSLLGLCDYSSFENESNIMLESLLKTDTLGDSYNLSTYKDNDQYILLPELIILNIINDLHNNISKEEIALKFHSTIVNYILNMCIKLSNTYLINTVALSGSIFENNFILKNTYNVLKNNNFNVLIPKGIPLNDGGISIGQIAISNNI